MNATAVAESELVMFERGTCLIKTTKGSVESSCLTHPYAPGLAVTSSSFGEFAVTHLPSGTTLGASLERMWSAASLMADWQRLAALYDFSWTIDQEAVQSVFAEKGGLTAEGENVSLSTIAGLLKSVPDFGGEFPYEDEHPSHTAMDIINKLGPVDSST